MAQWFLPYHLQLREMSIYPHKTANNEFSVLNMEFLPKLTKLFLFSLSSVAISRVVTNAFLKGFLCCFTIKVGKDAPSIDVILNLLLLGMT